jgi:hypothetical protein
MLRKIPQYLMHQSTLYHHGKSGVKPIFFNSMILMLYFEYFQLFIRDRLKKAAPVDNLVGDAIAEYFRVHKIAQKVTLISYCFFF